VVRSPGAGTSHADGAPPASATLDRVSPVQTFHRYRLIRRIARGGMAEVFLAAHRGAAGFERRVALKKILPVYSGMEEFAALFRDEARVAAALDHSGIVQVYDFGEHTGEYYIAMEYVDGPDLEEVLDRCRRRGILPPVEAVLHIGHRLAGCLEYAHTRFDERGRALEIIHRDVSPPNVLIGVQGEIKLTDFGVAKSALREAMTRPGVLRGKYAYMSPEQVGQKAMDQRSDLFSLGTVLYEALTGVNPFEGSTDYQTMESVGAADVEPAGFLRPDTPAELDRILVTCLEPDPQHRYQDAGALRRDLAALMLDYPRSDDPQCLVDFLKDVFPERSAAEDRAALLDGSVPAWEMLAHRLSPFLVSLPAPPVGATPLQLVSKPGAPDPEGSAARPIFREVGPRARRKRGTDKTLASGEDTFVTAPGSEAPASERPRPRGSFLPPVDESLDRVSLDSLPVLGEPDPEPAPEVVAVVPPLFRSLAHAEDPLLDDLSVVPPRTDGGVPIVNEWDLDEADWSPPPRQPSSGRLRAVAAGDLPPSTRPLGAVIEGGGGNGDAGFPEELGWDDSPEPDTLDPDAFAFRPVAPPGAYVDPAGETDGAEGDTDGDDPSHERVATQPSLSPAPALMRFADRDEDAFGQEAVDRLLQDAGPPAPDGLPSQSAEIVGTQTGDSLEAVRPQTDPSLDSLAGALHTGTVPGAPGPRPATEGSAASSSFTSFNPISPVVSTPTGMPAPRSLPARPRSRRRAPVPAAGRPPEELIEGWDVEGPDGMRPLAELLSEATAGGTQPAAPAWPISPEELQAWKAASAPGRREPEPSRTVPTPAVADPDLEVPSSPALKALHGEFPPPPRPAHDLTTGPGQPHPVERDPARTPPRRAALERRPILSQPGAPRRARPGTDGGAAPPLRLGRAPRSAAPSRPGLLAPESRPGEAPSGADLASNPASSGAPASPAPAARSGWTVAVWEHRRTLLLAATAILVPLLLVFAAGRLDRDPNRPAPRATPDDEPETPRYVEPLSPVGRG
jgi:serine/threonine protein kinase